MTVVLAYNCNVPVIETIAAPPIARNNATFSVFSSAKSLLDGSMTSLVELVGVFLELEKILGLVVGGLSVGGSFGFIGISQLSPRNPRHIQKYSFP